MGEAINAMVTLSMVTAATYVTACQKFSCLVTVKADKLMGSETTSWTTFWYVVPAGSIGTASKAIRTEALGVDFRP